MKLNIKKKIRSAFAKLANLVIQDSIIYGRGIVRTEWWKRVDSETQARAALAVGFITYYIEKIGQDNQEVSIDVIEAYRDGVKIGDYKIVISKIN